MGGVIQSTLAEVELAVSEDEINQYAAITDDYNPIHLDADFAARTPMGGVIAHGTMSLGLIWQMLRRNFGAERVGKAELSIRFTRPVRPGDTVRAGGTPAEDGSITVWVRNQDDTDVIMGSVRL